MSDSNTREVLYRASKQVSTVQVILRSSIDLLITIKRDLRHQIADELPDCNACVTYAYFMEVYSPLTDTKRTIKSLAEVTSFDAYIIVHLVAQCITQA